MKVPWNPHGLFPAMGCAYVCFGVAAVEAPLQTSGNWNTSLEVGVVQPADPCWNAPISVKVSSSGDEGWECEGDWVW